MNSTKRATGFGSVYPSSALTGCCRSNCPITNGHDSPSTRPFFRIGAISGNASLFEGKMLFGLPLSFQSFAFWDEIPSSPGQFPTSPKMIYRNRNIFHSMVRMVRVISAELIDSDWSIQTTQYRNLLKDRYK